MVAAETVGRQPGLVGRKAVVAKLGMDAHWRGVIVVAHALRDAGMEVVYLGHATPGQLVTAVVQEDPALVGLSSLSGNHLELWKHLAAVGNDPFVASSMRTPTLVFDGVQVAGT